MTRYDILGIPVRPTTKAALLARMQHFLESPTRFFHLVSMNPEIIMEARHNPEFLKCIHAAEAQLIDGAGTAWALKKLHGVEVEKWSGADCMEYLMEYAGDSGLRILLIGGRPGVAEQIAKNYQHTVRQGTYEGMSAFSDISHPTQVEEDALFQKIVDYKPQIIFSSFGSPAQELWFYRNQHKLQGIIGIGVGGAFDYMVGAVPRAPQWMQENGLEWLYRLILQPWRWKRQINLLKFGLLVLGQ